MKLRNLAGAFLAFACAAFCGNLRAGNVWEFIPDSPTGVTYQPGEEITFRMRLLTPNYEKPEDKRTPWMLLPNMDNFEVSQTFLSDPEHAMGILMGKFPFGIGVVANGKTYSATYVTENVTNANYVTDFTFRYPVQCGDFALPLRLAADRNGTPVNSWDPDSSKASNRYFFFYGPDDANYIWKISTSNGDAFVPQMVGQAEAELTIMEREVLPYNAAGDYLRGFKWTLETLAFDEVTEPGDDDKDYWRCVRGTSRPTIVPTDGLILDSGRRVYAWIAPAGGSDDDPNTWTGWTENDYAVTIPLDGDRNVAEMVFRDPDGTSRKHNVYTFTLAPGQTSYELRELKGLHVGGTARVILSGSPHWNMVGNGSTGTFLTTDYRMRTVYCGEQKPTISVSLDNYSTTTAVVFPNANHELRDYTRAERLRVRLEGVDVHEAFKVKLAFDLAGDTAFPTNVIAISTDEAAGYLDKNLLKGMEVSFAENADEATESEDGLYLFLLGATTNTTVNPGITITPVPNASLTATVQKTNALHVVIRGINPVVTAVNDVEAEPGVPVAVKEVRGGGNLECRVRIEDSYRNLRLLDAGGTDGVYTVTFNRGYGNSLTITNNASGGALVPVDYFSDGYAYLDFKVPYTSITNTYTATFKLKNPDGLESKTYVLTVPVIPSAKVAASAPEGKVTSDGFYELMEDSAKSYRIDFTLSDTLEAEAAGYDKLYAFLEPVNEAASNRTDGAFFTKCSDGKAGTGVPIDMLGENRGKGSTAWGGAGGGIKILDGDGAGDGSGQTARYNVVLCTQPTYSNEFVFAGYDGSTTKFTLILDNHEPELKQLVIWEVIKGTTTTNDVDVITSSGKAAANRVHKGNDVVVGPMTKADWKDVAYDIDATNADLMVTRWLVYRLNDSGEKERWDAYYTYGPDEKLVIPGGLTVYGGKDTTYLFEVQIQDKDMRALGTAGLIEDEDESSGWAYRVYKNLPNFEPDWAGDDEANVWGPLFTFTVVASDKPNVDIAVREEGSTLVQGVRAFGEDQLTPLNGSIYSDDDMRLVVSLAEQFDRKTEVKVLLTLSAVDAMNVNGGFVKLAETNVYFVGANRSAEVKISDFDATYRDGKVQRGYAKYQVKAEVVEPEAATNKYNATTCQFFVVNRPPRLELGAGSQQFSDYLDNPDAAYDVAKNEIQTVDWSATDIRSDLTNISVKATISGGKIIDGAGVEYTTYTYTATNSAVVATNYEDGAYNVAFKFKFSTSGTNTITFVATDKDGDSSERHVLRFAIPETKTLLLYPAKPTQPSTDSDDIADYFSAAGIGYGRVWADGDTKLSAIDKWIHDWTCSQGGVAKVYAMGYLANEREDSTSSAFVNTSGTGDTGTGYSPADENATFKHLDSFFYRWFAKLVAESGSDSNWTAYKPVPQVSTNRSTAAAGTVMSMSFPKKTGVNDREYNDISALAIFSRELLKSDNMGDINADGVPDSYVVKYKLVEEFAGGNDLKDVNFAEDGSTPYCLDYLPQVLTVRYSKLIPELTEISNIENAEAFTPRLKIRGYDETDVQSLAKRRATYGAVAEFIPGISALNDAADLAGIDGAKPDRRYTNPREDADSTLNYVEWLAWSEYAAANRLDPTNAVNWTKWSPERPTDPTKADFDNDGFTDGYEYYAWYRAHVGYIDADGCHRYLTGRAYDPRNPGEGRFISSERIVELFDPRAKGASSTQDTDNDGLPDLVEFEIGTNPFDFDTDGDGLPDGFEIMLGGTDPLLAETTKGISDAMRNFDGDAMAFTTPYLERNGFVEPKPLHTDALYAFALVDPKGDTDGIQWYVSKTAPANIVATDAAAPGTSFTVDGITYVTSGSVPVVSNETVAVLAVDLEKATTWTTTNAAPEGVETEATLFALMPTRVPAGTVVSDITPDVPYATFAFDADVKGVNAAWVYGRSVSTLTKGDSLANLGGFGMLTVGRYQDAKAKDATGGKAQIAALPAEDAGVAYLHHFVYQEFGFDPRTAWNANTPLAPRWGTTATSDGTTETVANNVSANYGYAGVATRTREFTLYDEFLVISFFLNNGKLAAADVTPTQVRPWETIWSEFTTNGQGPNEPNWEKDNEHYKGRTAESNSGENGCDTDQDGVPDGWELYVMAGPKVKDSKTKTLVYHLAAPYNDGFYSSFGPFVADATSKSQTDNTATGANDSAAGDGDGLTELQEFAGTDSCGYYNGYDGAEGFTVYSTTIRRPSEHAEWLNKFFPTDPWNKDTDGDGLRDNEFANQGSFKCGNFRYGTPVDDGKMTAIPGGGLNPCTVDTDGDGLPDTWEAQYAGQLIYTGEDAEITKGRDGEEGNPRQGLCDGMDGTVWDAFNSPRINNAGENYRVRYSANGGSTSQVVDRDYDRDGLENWQEYLTCAMRCWRYDDPLSPWDYIPYEEYFDEFGFNPDYEALSLRAGTVIEDFETFLYYTLFDKTSPIYNPHFITDASSGAQYFSRVTNGWDRAFSDAGTYYIFYDRVNDGKYADIWGYLGAAPKKYIGTSPVRADSDKDGMDDYYELFHGMNPILGGIGVRETSDNPCDLVFDAWYSEQLMGSPAGDAGLNVWRARSAPQDFILYPWMNGLVDADPDGDDIRNQDEAIMPMVAPVTTWYHTDPTPLWMTDSTYADSLVRRFFRMPVCFFDLEGVPESIIGPDGKEHFLRDCDGFAYVGPDKTPTILGADPDQWLVSDADHMNWLFSFEENEGFDADHDAISDFDEIKAKFRSKTDPQDFDSPRRRQAMYFPGPAQPSALQSLPFAKEAYPRAAMGYPDDMSLLQYTVECWVMPEARPDGTVADSTVIERAVYVNPSHCADEQYVRCNFRIAIRGGKWYTMFDANGTMKASKVEVLGTVDAKPGEWTYVAATYDTKKLTLYVNGEIDNYVVNSVKPAYGSSAVVLFPGDGWTSSTNGTVEGDIEASKGEPHNYWFDLEYELHAFLIGASFTTAADGSPHSSQLNVLNGAGWDGRYKDFFQGYVDEIRVWDGAQDAATIFANFANRVRFTREDALANRSEFFKEWSVGKRRYAVDGDGNDVSVTPELRFHWSFDSVPGAENARQVALAPNGFIYGAKPSQSSPAGYEIPWWRAVIDGYGSVYAGLGNWVTWIPNTVTHLPRFDLSTLDSTYWSENFAGDKAGTYRFARTAEPVSRWTQMIRNQTQGAMEFRTTGRRFWQSYNTGSNATDTLDLQFEFTGRHLNLMGDDLLPLGGAFVKYVKTMWDDQGASSMWELTGIDRDGDGLPNWWQEYADQNYRRGLDPEEPIGWNTKIWYEVGGTEILITAGEAYQRDLAKGMYVDRNGEHHPTLDEIDEAREAGTDWSTDYAQTAKSDKMIPDWWKSLKKIDDEQPLADTDNDGLNNYHEYVVSELLPFRLQLDPLKAKTQYGVLDYFRKVGSLYLGEMLTDHDQMEDHWERSLGNPNVADATKWDALKDADEDGWNNFAENRYNGYSMSTLAQLVAHAMGDNEVLDAPIPSIKMKVRYNGDRPLAASSEDGAKKDGDTKESDAAPALVVHAYSKSGRTGSYVMNPDAAWTVTPGVAVDKEVYLGGWEDRIVRGTMAPGNIDLGSVNIMFAQVPQNDLYSWTDESGTHLAGTYKEFKEAFDKNPDIIQNIQNFTWLELVPPTGTYTSSDKAVTVTRDGKLQENARFAVYGEPVGTINLSTGDFEFDMAAMNKLRVNYTYDGGKGPAAAWSYKEAIFKITYTAKVPSTQLKAVDFSLAKADRGFVRGGLNSIEVFYDLPGGTEGMWDPGEPFGVVNDIDIGWAGRDVEIELTDMSAVTPRIKLWGAGSGGKTSGGGASEDGSATSAADSDRGVRVGLGEVADGTLFDLVTPADRTLVTVSRYRVDGNPLLELGKGETSRVLSKTFESKSRDYLHEGDFLVDGKFDIDWDHLYEDIVSNEGVQSYGSCMTNVSYLVTFNWDPSDYLEKEITPTPIRACSTIVTRRFERTRTVPTPCPKSAVFNTSRPTFEWKIENEDPWASFFGTTYTAFKVRVKDLSGNLVYDSGFNRLPARDSEGVYRWTAPLYAGEPVSGTDVLFKNLTDYTWEVAVYNAKFRTDSLMSVDFWGEHTGNPFSTPETFRMNVTSLDASSRELAVRVCYTGPATNLMDRLRVQAFTTPDFTGDPVAETVIRYLDTDATTKQVDSLSPIGSDANVRIIGLPTGSYFIRAYIDTNGNGVRDDWESWGYLSERDLASKPGIFNPVRIETSLKPTLTNVRKIFIEDCDTDGDWFPDVWEAEQNGGVFDRTKVAPVSGDAELIGINPELKAVLNASAFPMLEALSSKAGLALISGIPPTRISTVERSDGTLGIAIDNTVESVRVTGFDFTADGNVEITVDAVTTTGSIDASLASLYALAQSGEMDVTCNIYRKAKLSDKSWTLAGSSTVRVGGGPVMITVKNPVAGNGGFYKAVIVEK